jgi:Brp/Blh family beta-carotene 15,15'-monooxygenase
MDKGDYGNAKNTISLGFDAPRSKSGGMILDMGMTDHFLMLDQSSLIALAFVALIGLPHGAFDGAIARHLGYSRTLGGLIKFITVYLGLAVAVVAFWVWQPGLALALFLLISAVHFGYGDATAASGIARALQIAAHGGVAVFGVSLFHLQQVTPIYAALTNGDVMLAVMMTKIFPFFIMPVAVSYLVVAIRDAGLRPRLIELALLCLLLSVVPPLVGFAIYFCVIHTGRHMRHIWYRVSSNATPRHILSQAVWFTLASWGGGVIMLFWLDSGNISQDLLQVIFIGLAALTVPHMILVDGLFRRRDLKDAI